MEKAQETCMKSSIFKELSKNDYHGTRIIFIIFSPIRNFEIKCLEEINTILLNVWNILNNVVISKMKKFFELNVILFGESDGD